jgi:hypothetical protein
MLISNHVLQKNPLLVIVQFVVYNAQMYETVSGIF